MNFSIVVASCIGNGIGIRGTLPWKLPADLRRFRDLTTSTLDPTKRNAVIMGRKTWQSLPARYKPLPNRINIVLSKSLIELEDAVVCESLDIALVALATEPTIENVFVIGGNGVYQEAMRSPYCQFIYQTNIHDTFDCDTFFPTSEGFKEIYKSAVMEDGGLKYDFVVKDVEKPAVFIHAPGGERV